MKRILVVDDAKGIRNFVRDVLEPKGYEVLEAANPYDARQIANAEKPDIILCDTSLGEEVGGRDGLELAIQLFKDGVVDSEDRITGMSGEDKGADWKRYGFAFTKKNKLLEYLNRLIREH